MQLTLVISSLSSGGAERVMSIMANYWASKSSDWNITLLTFDDGSQPPFYDLDERIFHIPLGIAKDSPNMMAGLWNNLKSIKKLRVAISKSQPDAVISFMNQVNILTLLAMQGLNIPVIISERTVPAYAPISIIWKILSKIIYPIADHIVVQTKEVSDYFPELWQNKISVIPNPVLLPKLLEIPSQKLLPKYSIIATGRLSKEKNFPLLLKAFATISQSYPEWSLIILGEGSLRSELELLCNQLNIANLVHFPGRVKNPYQYLQQADLFVMSSSFEGFPNALCEAMACGLPVISTDCPSGPRQIIRDNLDGILVPNNNVDALAKAIVDLISDEKKRQRLGDAAKEITERFNLDKIMKMWEKLLKEITSMN